MTRTIVALACLVGWSGVVPGCSGGDDSSTDDGNTEVRDGDGGADADGDADGDSEAGADSGSDADSDSDAEADADAGTGCDPLPGPTGRVLNVDPSTIGDINGVIAGAGVGDTIEFTDGTYDLAGIYLWVDRPGITLRSASGNRDAVILDGGYTTTEVITIAVSDVTVADLTIRRARTHGIHVVSTDAGDTRSTLIYNVRIVDPSQQAIKINPGPPEYFVDDGVVACSRLEMTDEGRPHIDPTSGGCYTGGIDAHQARGWVFRDNEIEGFWCAAGLSEHGIHCWRGCRDTLVERNVLVDNARGIGFGLATDGTARTYSDDPCPEAAGGYVDHYGGIVRNNFVFASRAELFASSSGFDCGICLWSACRARVVHNSVVSTSAPFSSIEWRFATSAAVDISNNIVTHSLLARDGASATEGVNLHDATLDLFVDGAAGDLHLAPSALEAIDQGLVLAPGLCTDDIDGDPRDSTPDIGADEI